MAQDSGNLRALAGAKGMIALVWRYEVVREARAAFEATYAPTGAWAQLFARSDGYRGTELFRSEDGSYLTLDIWRSRTDFDASLLRIGGITRRSTAPPAAGPRRSTGSGNMR